MLAPRSTSDRSPFVESGVSKRELLVFFYKYRLRLFMAFLVPFIFFIIVSFMPVPRYQASAVLIVRLGSEYVYQPETGSSQGGPEATIPFDQNQIFKAEVAILNSDDLHQEVIQSIGINRIFPELTQPPQGLDSVIESLKAFIAQALQGLGAPSRPVESGNADRILLARAVEIFDKRLDIILEKESSVINLGYENKDPEIAVQTLNTLLKLYFDKRKQLYIEPRAELAQTQAQSTRDRALAAERAVEEFKREHKIYSFADQRSELLQERAEAQKQASTVSDPAVEQQIAGYNHQLDQLDALERQFSNLERDAQIANDSYSLYSHKLDEANAYEDLQRERASSVRIIQPPTVPPEPKKLQPLIILAGLFLSFVFMLLTAAVTEFFRSGFATPERLEQNLGLPVLAVLPLRKRR